MSPNPVFELRRYRLKPGRCDDLIKLFEREFVESQIAAGMALHGFYRDSDDPNAFIWFRSFSDMPSRAKSLAAFYGGPIWESFGPAANDTMINSDNVLLLRPVGRSPFALERRAGSSGQIIVLTIYSLAPGREDEFAMFFAEHVEPLRRKSGARNDARFVTERSSNTFPRLPVREGETVYVDVEAFESAAAYASFEAALAASPEWVNSVQPRLDQFLWRRPETARLSPTRRSAHGW